MRYLFCISLLLFVLVLKSVHGQGEVEEFENDAVEDTVAFTSKENGQGKTETFGLGNIAQSPATDFIQMLDLPITSMPTFRVKVKYSIAGPRILVVEVLAVAVDHTKTIHHTEWTETTDYGEIKMTVVKVNLPDSLVYKEDKAINIQPDLHSEYLLIRASMVDYENPSVLFQHTEQSMKLIPPWRRIGKKGYSCSWKGMILKKFSENKIPKCPKIDDVVNILPYTVALTASEHGYKKFFDNIRQPGEKFTEENQNVIPQFTLTTWLYLTQGCANDMCPLIYHIKGNSYLTPLIGLLKSGYLHIQVHYKDGSGYAFLIDAQIPIHKWVHIAITFKGTVITLCIRHGRNLQNSKVFVHSEFPAGIFHYNDTDGYWAAGGSPGFASPQGFIGPAKIYRRRVLPVNSIEKIYTSKSKPNLEILNYFKNCRKLKSVVKVLLKKQNKEKKSCLAHPWPGLRNASVLLNCPSGIVGPALEIVNVSELWSNETAQPVVVQNNIYNYAVKMIKYDKSKVKDALNFLSYSSCLGHSPSLYLMAVLYGTGFGMNVDARRFQTSLLIGALNLHPLSQMSLAYKHLIGADGFPKDYDIAEIYYRHAADASNQFLNQHNEVDTHAEAVRLDKNEDLDDYRGPKSNWFSWLKHLAKQGATDAQSALGELFYYGARGFKRNLTKAAEFYEMGANRGDAQMLFNLGVVKLRGQGVSKNEEEARDLLNKAADLGFAPAFNALGFYELHIRKNTSGALHYFKHAAEQDDRDGLFNMGFAYENALEPGSTPNLKLAVPYFIDAANKGHPGGCIAAGDAFSKGDHVDRNTHLAIIYFKFVADQLPEIGFHLRSGLDEYFEGAWYTSLLYYLLAAEAGMEVAQYNVALLCEWNWGGVSKHTEVDCMWRYYNQSAKLEWVPSMIKTGDNFWYGITTRKNITAAAKLYSKAATKEQNSQAIYNLGYLVENNYPLDGLDWMYFHPSSADQGNLSLAAILYKKCRDSSNEALVPCSLGLFRVAIKMAWQFQLANNEVLLIPSMIFIVVIGLLICIFRISGGDNETMDVA